MAAVADLALALESFDLEADDAALHCHDLSGDTHRRADQRGAEMADVETLFDAPSHPYTQALLASIPSLDHSGDRLVTIPGSVPGVGLMPKGCRFAPRCPHVKEACRPAPPPLAEFGTSQSVACLRPFGYVRDEEGRL